MASFTCKSKHSIHLQWRFPKINCTHAYHLLSSLEWLTQKGGSYTSTFLFDKGDPRTDFTRNSYCAPK